MGRMNLQQFKKWYKKENPKYDWNSGCADDNLRLYYANQKDYEWNPGSVLLCPGCGQAYLQRIRRTAKHRDVDFSMTYECQLCDEVSRLEFKSDEGYTFLKWVKTTELKTGHMIAEDIADLDLR